MQAPQLLEEFIRFGLAALLGFLIGLEREMKAGEDTQTGLRDFVLYALLARHECPCVSAGRKRLGNRSRISRDGWHADG